VLVLRSPEQASRIADAAVRELVRLRFAQIAAGEPYDPDRHGYTIVVEPGDTVDAIERESGCSVSINALDEAREPLYLGAEVVEEHRGFYEVVFILNDDGFGIEIIVPKAVGVDAEILAMCARFATPALDRARP
jgi:hypothetical protein